MCKNLFELKVDKTFSRLSGNRFGRSVFEEQVKDTISYMDKIIIIFPDFIKKVGVSFIQGFFEEMISTLGINEFENNVDIKSNTIPNLKSIVMDELL